MQDYNKLPFRQFTAKSEADKAINSLKGILLGVNLDSKVNDAELSELKNWCTKHHEFINRNPFKEFMEGIAGILKKDVQQEELIEDLLWLIYRYEPDGSYYTVATADLQTLQGICHGILSDGIINDQEILALDIWLEENEHLASYYPYDELRSLIVSVLSDGRIDEGERKRIMAYFKEFVNLTDSEMTSKIKYETADINISGICTVDPDIDFSGKIFCFTGLSKMAKRSDIEKQIKALGGVFNNTVSKTTDYLIVGDGGNPCWAFACYGRKVETAIGLRKKGYPISLVHEFDFWDFVQDKIFASNRSLS